MYAWGFPLIIAGTAVIFDNLPQDNFPSVLRPKFGYRNCWFHGKSIFSLNIIIPGSTMECRYLEIDTKKNFLADIVDW